MKKILMSLMLSGCLVCVYAGQVKASGESADNIEHEEMDPIMKVIGQLDAALANGARLEQVDQTAMNAKDPPWAAGYTRGQERKKYNEETGRDYYQDCSNITNLFKELRELVKSEATEKFETHRKAVAGILKKGLINPYMGARSDSWSCLEEITKKEYRLMDEAVAWVEELLTSPAPEIVKVVIWKIRELERMTHYFGWNDEFAASRHEHRSRLYSMAMDKLQDSNPEIRETAVDVLHSMSREIGSPFVRTPDREMIQHLLQSLSHFVQNSEGDEYTRYRIKAAVEILVNLAEIRAPEQNMPARVVDTFEDIIEKNGENEFIVKTIFDVFRKVAYNYNRRPYGEEGQLPSAMVIGHLLKILSCRNVAENLAVDGFKEFTKYRHDEYETWISRLILKDLVPQLCVLAVENSTENLTSLVEQGIILFGNDLENRKLLIEALKNIACQSPALAKRAIADLIAIVRTGQLSIEEPIYWEAGSAETRFLDIDNIRITGALYLGNIAETHNKDAATVQSIVDGLNGIKGELGSVAVGNNVEGILKKLRALGAIG